MLVLNGYFIQVYIEIELRRGKMKRDFYFSRVRLFLLSGLVLLLIAGFSAALLVMAGSSEESTGELIFVGFVDVLLIFTLFLLAKNFSRKEANVTVSDEGLTIRGTGGPGFIPWEEIDGVLPYEVHNNSLLGIILKDEEKYLESLPKNKQRVAKINIKTGFPAFNIGLGNLKHKKELVELLIEMKIPFYLPSTEKEPLDHDHTSAQ
jgi:hypothetical protein